MATHSSVLAWRIPGMGEPGGLPSMGSHRIRHYWSDLATKPWFLRCCRGLPWLLFSDNDRVSYQLLYPSWWFPFTKEDISFKWANQGRFWIWNKEVYIPSAMHSDWHWFFLKLRYLTVPWIIWNSINFFMHPLLRYYFLKNILKFLAVLGFCCLTGFL